MCLIVVLETFREKTLHQLQTKQKTSVISQQWFMQNLAKKCLIVFIETFREKKPSSVANEAKNKRYFTTMVYAKFGLKSA